MDRATWKAADRHARRLPSAPHPDWRPQPLRQFIVKIHGRCDLACDYCYMFETADQSWRDRPRAMSRPILDRLARRIAEHAEGHGLSSVEVVLHGGEPLLAGEQTLTYAVETIRAAAGPRTRVGFTIQTNAVRLSDSMLDLLLRHDIGIGVSLDGDRVAHDRHRRRSDGRGSFDAVSEALARLDAHPARRLFRGLLCTVDLRNPPADTYRSLARFGPPMVDFLLPHGNWDELPPGLAPDAPETPYADWLIEVFDIWYGSPAENIRVRRFEEIINVLLGGRSGLEGVGLSAAGSIVVETDGSVLTADSLTTAFEGAGRTGLDVMRDPFDAVLTRPDVISRQSGAAGLSGTCRRCSLHQVCGGGLRTHRFRSGTGFDNPSVYCRDLARLIGHVRGRLQRDADALRADSA